MTDSERAQILRMIDEGKITAEEGLKLMQALALDEEAEAAPYFPTAEAGGEAAPEPDPVVERLKRKVRSFYVIPLFSGVVITILLAWLMYQAVEKGSLGFAFYCLMFPLFLFGIGLVGLGASSQKSSWVYVDIQQKPGEHPGRIMLGFPLEIVRWLAGTFKGFVPGQERDKVELVLNAINTTTSQEPLVVQVDEGEDGDKVNVYIG